MQFQLQIALIEQHEVYWNCSINKITSNLLYIPINIVCIIGEQRRINRTPNAQLEPIAVTSQSSLIDVVIVVVVVVLVALVIARITCKKN